MTRHALFTMIATVSMLACGTPAAIRDGTPDPNGNDHQPDPVLSDTDSSSPEPTDPPEPQPSVEAEVDVTGARPRTREEMRTMANRLAGAVERASPVSTAYDAAYSKRPNLPGRYNPNFHTESYGHFVENTFQAVAHNPLSTFSIDVDRASYANIRRFIRNGSRPPIDAVRIEEMVNYFTYEYPDPRNEHPFTVTTEVGRAPWRPAHQLVRIGLQGRRIDVENLPPSNLVFLLDVSGSMHSPDKLPLLKQAFRMLVHELRPEDRVAITVYAGAAGIVLESTPGTNKHRILEAIDRLEAGGSTAGGAGIRLAYEVARRHHIEGGNNRVILATDGDFNVGESSDAAMIRLIEEEREHDTFLTVLGFGTGNLQDSKMEALADHGNGNFAYIDTVDEAKKVLVTEMGGTLLTIAKDVKLQIEFNPDRVQAYRLIGYENRVLAAEDFNDDKKDAGELGAGHTVTALYEIVPTGIEPEVEIGGVDSLRYQRPTGPRSEEASDNEMMFVKLRYKQPNGDTSRLLTHPVQSITRRPSTDFRFVTAVAGFGMLLRDSDHIGNWTLANVLESAKSGKGSDLEGYRAEFIDLVETVIRGEMVATR